MQIAYIPFGVNAGCLIIGDRQRRDAKKNARVAYIPQDANVNSEGTHPAGEGTCRSTAFF